MQSIAQEIVAGEYDAILLMGPPGCGKTRLCQDLVSTLRGAYGDNYACHVAHSAAIAVNIGGQTISYAFHYGKWAGQGHYIEGAEEAVADMKVIALEEAQAAGCFALEDLCDHKFRAHQQV